jgi:hypothetical protein
MKCSGIDLKTNAFSFQYKLTCSYCREAEIRSGEFPSVFFKGTFMNTNIGQFPLLKYPPPSFRRGVPPQEAPCVNEYKKGPSLCNGVKKYYKKNNFQFFQNKIYTYLCKLACAL